MQSQKLSFRRKTKTKSDMLCDRSPRGWQDISRTQYCYQTIDKNNDLYSVFLSGNGPLVAILREALARDKVRNEKEKGRKVKKGEAMSEVKMFIQNVHNFRDECLIDFKNHRLNM